MTTCWECGRVIHAGEPCESHVEERHDKGAEVVWYHVDCDAALLAYCRTLLPALSLMMMLRETPCLCGGAGADEGRYCHCVKGQMLLRADYEAHAWMKPLVREYNELKRCGLHEDAAELKESVLR